MKYIFFLVILISSACSKKQSTTDFLGDKKRGETADKIASLLETSGRKNQEKFHGMKPGSGARHEMIAKQMMKKMKQTLAIKNEKLLASIKGHSKIYPFNGQYRVMVIPVQFSDKKFSDEDFFKEKAQEYIFGNNPNSMTSYYKHVSMGRLELSGEITPIITMKQPLAFYGEAITGRSDKNARGLVVEAIKELKKIKTDRSWWLNFDSWDLSDYDLDKNFHESDGFIDAVVLVYAGKSQASCQAVFDKSNIDPASSEVPPGPRHDATIECFNRLWPHRWTISLPSDSPDYSRGGPLVEGKRRHSMNGLKIYDDLFALDYNMQSEFSDRSTFIHEFGHSLSLPDIYSSGKSNSTGLWEVMSQNASLQGQEMSSFSRLSLGWLSPKVVEQGEETSAYLGAYSFVSEEQRNKGALYTGPNLSEDGFSILSSIPEFDEDVYRSMIVVTSPTTELKEIVKTRDEHGTTTAYSGHFHSATKALIVKIKVPASGSAKLSFDAFYAIETETNFKSKDQDIKVITDYDIGKVIVEKDELDQFRLISGDLNENSLNESNPKCNEHDVLSLREKMNSGLSTPEDEKEFLEKYNSCKAPSWVKKENDLSKYAGKEVKISIEYTTDPAINELGIVIDNIKLGNTLIDFENTQIKGGFTSLKNGKKESSHNQFYLFEYRTPGEKYLLSGNDQVSSFNMDNNISAGTQSMFIGEGKNLLEDFRMVTFDYKPGVVVWYFNSKYGRRSNDSAAQNGKGYLLILNSKVEELTIPGIFSEEKFKKEDGSYDMKNKELVALRKNQKDLFICFSHTQYSAYQEGKEPECDTEFKDYMSNIYMGDRSLFYRRALNNTILPKNRYSKFSIGKPFRNYAAMRTGLSTFTPKSRAKFKPFKIYKEEDGQMVLDRKMTDQAISVENIHYFTDAKSKLPKNKRFHGDSVVVEKKGFSFKVVEPSTRALDMYGENFNADLNENWFRRPRAKIYFNWN